MRVCLGRGWCGRGGGWGTRGSGMRMGTGSEQRGKEATEVRGQKHGQIEKIRA